MTFYSFIMYINDLTDKKVEHTAITRSINTYKTVFDFFYLMLLFIRKK